MELKRRGLTVAYSPRYLDWQLGEEHEVNPIRTHVVVEELLGLQQFLGTEVLTSWADPGGVELSRWAAAASSVSEEVFGEEELTMFGGTYALVERLIRDRVLGGEVGVYFNPAGGEIAEHKDVKVYNDAAYAVRRLSAAGLRVGFLSWDAHQELNTRELISGAGPCISIHEAATVKDMEAGDLEGGAGFLNYALAPGAGGDVGLLRTVQSAISELRKMELDVLVVRAAADGLVDDRSSSLRITENGYRAASMELAEAGADLDWSFLVLGGGGTLPLDGTPEVWRIVLSSLVAVPLFTGRGRGARSAGFRTGL